jgi:uncharacterized membrane protein YkvA (DUF1232 family)
MSEEKRKPSLFERIKIKAKEIKAETFTLALAYKSPATPWYAKVFAAVVVAYAFSPIDLIPDFIPVLGYLDDIVLVPLGITLALKMIPEEALAEARLEAQEVFPDGKPKNWVVGAIIILIWVLLAALVIFWSVRWIRELIGG